MSAVTQWQEGLTNGARLLFRPRSGFAGAAVALWLHNGVRHQGPGEDGFAHLLEHLAMAIPVPGEADPPYGVPEALGGRVNAQTGRELTALYGLCPGERAGELAAALARRLLPRAIPADLLAGEVSVIEREAALHRATAAGLEDRLLADALGGHPLARPLAGTDGALAAATPEAIAAYWQRVVVGNRLTVVVTGDFDADAVRAALTPLAELDAGELPATTRPAWREPEPIPDQAAQAGRLLWLMPAPGLTDPAWGAARLADHLTGGGLTGRLVRAVRQARGAAYSVRSRLESYSDLGLWWLEAETDAGRLDACEAAFHEVVTELAANAPAPSEVAAASRQLEARRAIDRDDLTTELEVAALEAVFGKGAADPSGPLLDPGQSDPEAIRAFAERAGARAWRARA
jgi:predicted Zn-dependent peptidase